MGEDGMQPVPEGLLQFRITFHQTQQNLTGRIPQLQNHIEKLQPIFETLVFPHIRPHKHLDAIFHHRVRLVVDLLLTSGIFFDEFHYLNVQVKDVAAEIELMFFEGEI